MAWRWRKVFGRGPLRTTVSKKGVGFSFGIPGLRYGVSPDGRRYVSVGIPGTGLYWIKYLSENDKTHDQEKSDKKELAPQIDTTESVEKNNTNSAIVDKMKKMLSGGSK